MIAGDAAFSAAWFLGPAGGMIGLAFGAGAVAGWNFAVRTVLKLTNKRFDDLKEVQARTEAHCNERIGVLEQQIREFSERERSGMERQLGQIRQSTVRVLRDDDPI